MACMKNGFLEGQLLDGRFVALSALNHGSFGMVFLAKDTKTDGQVAIKCLTKFNPALPYLENTTNDHLVELLCHDRLGYHSNIVNLVHAFETEAHMFLVLEFCSMGDLYEAIRLGRGPLETEHVRAFMLQLIDAVDFMHSKGLYHRDIKPENIFLASDGSMKLGDFGLSTTESWTWEVCVGSDRYMAPEQYDPGETGYSPAQADIWSIGICLLNILFSRNPFLTPTESDVLFADFVRNRESLFDIFPSMSQGTFDILTHAMAIDPTKRSLSTFRTAIENVASFTSEDDMVDDFCTEDREVMPVTANRQPLRTPSIQSPPVEQSGAFPWAKILHMSPPQPAARQLSAIPDADIDDELFPEKPSAKWYETNNADTKSLASMIDSALGASIKSMTLREPKPRNPAPVKAEPMSESMPAPKPASAMASVFAKNEDLSKSWSDMWDEDEEEEEDARRRYNARNWSSETVDEDVTLRPALVEIKNNSAVANTEVPPVYHDFGVFGVGSSENVASIDMHSQQSPKSPVYTPPAKRFIADKWAALGTRRRAAATNNKITNASNGTTSGSTWRRGFGFRGFSSNKDSHTTFGDGFNLHDGARLGFNGWRRKENKTGFPSENIPGTVEGKDWRLGASKAHEHHLDQARHIVGAVDGDGDPEWVGGEQDLLL